MSGRLRIAVRRFEPFERAVVKQFADFAAATGADAELEVEALDLNPLHEALFAREGLKHGACDLAFLNTDWLAEAVATGALEDLRPHMARAPIPDFPHAWRPSMLRLQDFDGGFWGMPYHDGPECLIYRKDLLEAAGIAVPSTWAEFHAAARALHAPSEGRYGAALALYPDGHNGFYDFCIHVWSRGGEPFGPNAEPNLATAEAEGALDFLRSLAGDADAIAPGARELDSVKAGLLFCEGRAALAANWFGFAALGDASQGSAVKGRVGVAPLPAGPGGRSVSLNVFWVIALAAGSARKALAWEFLRHLATAPMDRLTTLEGAIGVRRSTWSDPDVVAATPNYAHLDALHAHARELPRHPRLAEISHAVDDLLTAAVTTARPSRDLLAEAQARIEAIVR